VPAGHDWEPDPVELAAILGRGRDLVKETPVFTSGTLSRRCGGDVRLKAENLQRTGSFKLRGTTAKLAALGDAACRGVVAGSAGNHGQALAYAARARSVPCTIFMPVDAAVSKVEAVAGFGAEVRLGGSTVDECVAAATELSRAEGLCLVHPFDDLDIVKGQAGLGVELAEQVPDLARVVVPVGGGGLISGVAAALAALRPEVEVLGVQAASCASLRASLAAGEPIAAERATTIADGIAVKRPGDLTLALIERWVGAVAEVDDEAIAAAMVLLVERAKLVTEGAGAAAVAALLCGVVEPAREGATVAVLSGGNVDAGVLAGVMDRAQTRAGRRLRLFTRISDRPGALAGLLAAVAGGGGNVIEVSHVRGGIELGVGQTGVELMVAVRGPDFAENLIRELGSSGYDVGFGSEIDLPQSPSAEWTA
jgi:threonine dehydratase